MEGHGRNERKSQNANSRLVNQARSGKREGHRRLYDKKKIVNRIVTGGVGQCPFIAKHLL